MQLGASSVTEIPVPSDEEAGVGDIAGKTFMWEYERESDIVTAVFETGEFIQFNHGYEGWMNLVAMGLFLGDAL